MFSDCFGNYASPPTKEVQHILEHTLTPIQSVNEIFGLSFSERLKCIRTTQFLSH